MLIKKQVEETVEVTLPFFSMLDKGYQKEYYAILESASFCILLGNHASSISIINDNSRILQAIQYEPITEMDFDFAYQMALDRLQKAVTNSEPQKAAI